MARKTRKTTKVQTRKMTPARAIALARETAQKAVDNGLAAVATARETAADTIDNLVKKGVALRAASHKAALAQARKARKVALAQANAAKARTAEAVSQLEHVFEQRVSRAISKLGVPTTKDVRALSRQVAQLQSSVESLRRSRARAAA